MTNVIEEKQVPAARKAKVLSEMRAARERYGTIKEIEFNFIDYVSEFDTEKGCGTVCCLWGWEPKFGVLPVTWQNVGSCGSSPRTILDWGYLPDYLYYPHQLEGWVGSSDLRRSHISEITGITLHADSTLETVLSAWDKVIDLLESTDVLDKYL